MSCGSRSHWATSRPATSHPSRTAHRRRTSGPRSSRAARSPEPAPGPAVGPRAIEGRGAHAATSVGWSRRARSPSPPSPWVGRVVVGRVVVRLRRIGATPGELEEHVVERRPPQPDVVDHDTGVRQHPGHLGERRHPVGDRGADPAVLLLARGLGAGRPSDQVDHRAHVGALGHDDVDAVAADAGLELGGRALGDDPSGVDDDDAVGELVGLVEVLGGEQDRRAAGDELADGGPHLPPVPGVESGGRLVQEQDPRRQDQGDGQVEPAPHPARVVLHRPVGGVGEAQPGQQLVGPALGRPPGQPVEPAEQHQVLPAAEDLVDGGLLAAEADPPLHGQRRRHDVDPGHRGRAAVGAQQGGEDADRRRLPRPVRSEQAAHGAGPHGQVEPVEGPLVAVDLHEAPGLDRQVVSVARHVVPSTVGRVGSGCDDVSSAARIVLRTPYEVWTIRYAVPGFNRSRSRARPARLRSCIMTTCHRRGRAPSRSAARVGIPTRSAAATTGGGTASDGHRSCRSTARSAPTPNHHRSARLAHPEGAADGPSPSARGRGRPDRYGRRHGRRARRRRPRVRGGAGRRPRGAVARPAHGRRGRVRGRRDGDVVRRGPAAGPRADRRTRPALAPRRLLRLGRTDLRHRELRLRRATAPGRPPGRQLVPGARGRPTRTAGASRRATSTRSPRPGSERSSWRSTRTRRTRSTPC